MPPCCFRELGNNSHTHTLTKYVHITYIHHTLRLLYIIYTYVFFYVAKYWKNTELHFYFNFIYKEFDSLFKNTRIIYNHIDYFFYF